MKSSIVDPVDGTTCYTYDGDGDRVATTNCNVVNAGNGSTSGINTEFFYDFNHRLMAQINVGSEQIQRANIYAGEEFLAEDSPDPFFTDTTTATQLRITDQVGSLRSLQDLGNPKGLWPGAWRSFPYGDGATAGDGGDSGDLPGGMLFTGKMKDPESTLDYFGAKYYNSNMGRFTSPDPSMESAVLELPQTWNKYSYVYNNPLSRSDPDGRCPICIGAVVGGVVEGGFDLGKQLYNNGGDLGNVSWGEVGANVVGGAVTGALAVATGGASLVENAVVGDIAAGATSNIVGGVVTRTLDPSTNSSDVLSASDVSADALAGLVGGAGGHVAADMVHLPEEPGLPRTSNRAWKTQARMAKYNAKVANRNRAIINQTVRAGIASSVTTHATNGMMGGMSYMWTFLPTPQDRSSVTTSESYSLDCSKNPRACK